MLEYNFCESNERKNHRKYILKKLEKILQEWIEEVAKIIFKDDPDKYEGATAKIFPFGSFKLGVMSPTSDIDCLCVVPKYINRH